MKRLFMALLFVCVSFGASALCASQSVPLVAGQTLAPDYAGLFKALRWTVTRDGDRVDVRIDYQKQKHLLCHYVGTDRESCSGLAGSPWAWDNTDRLDDWHTTIRYHGIAMDPPDAAGVRSFRQDYISGKLWESGSVLTELAVNATGKLRFAARPRITLGGASANTAGGC